MGKDKKEEKKEEKKKGGKAEPEKPKVEVGVHSMETRHILVEKHGQAMAVLELINSGKMTFNEAAREHSLDKAGRSGLLGWKRRDELDQDFWAGALAVPTGEYTKEPVKTQYGYHIIKVESKK